MNANKTFYIPIVTKSWTKIPVQAESIEDALKKLKEEYDDIDGYLYDNNLQDYLVKDAEYIFNSAVIEDGANGENDIQSTIQHFKNEWESTLEGVIE